jgi:fructose-specific phosphotransferase system IIA component
MLLIVMHNRRDYMDALLSLLEKQGITDVTVIEREGIGHDLVGGWTNFIYHDGDLSKEYDKALIAVVDSEEKTKSILDRIDNDSGLRWLNLEDRGFVCAVPFKKVTHLRLEASDETAAEPGTNVMGYLKQDRILLGLKARQKEECIRELSELLKGAPEIIDFDVFLKDVFEREKVSTTGIGNGVAIPHARTDGVMGFILAFGRSSGGVEFGSLDNQPARLVFLIGTPKTKDLSHYLRILAHMTRLLRKETLRKSLLEAATPQAIRGLFEKAENQGV